jgi:hypothetical protein
MCLHNISFNIVPWGSDTLLSIFVKIYKAFLRTIFLYLCQSSTSLATVNLCSFRTLFSYGNRKTLDSDKSGDCSRCSKVMTLCMARYFLTRTNIMHVQICEEYCGHFWPILCLLLRSPEYSSTPLTVFIIRRSWQLPAAWTVIDTSNGHQVKFMPLINLYFLVESKGFWQ